MNNDSINKTSENANINEKVESLLLKDQNKVEDTEIHTDIKSINSSYEDINDIRDNNENLKKNLLLIII